jgi:type IV secretory pathway VirB10-like protein
MKRCCRNLTYGLLFGLSLSLSSCGLIELIESRNRPTDETAVSPPPPAAPTDPAPTNPAPTNPAPTDPAQPAPAPQPPQATASPTPFTVLTAPQTLQPAPATANRENDACLTANYVANLTWQDNQPIMTLGRKSAEPTFRDTAATVKTNPDGSLTYEVNQGTLYYTRVYPDRSCLIQVVDPASGTAILEESGSLGEPV